MKYYSIHGLLNIATNVDVPVPEFFETKKTITNPDVQVMKKPLKFGKPRKDMIMRTNYYFWKNRSTLFIDYNMRDMKLKLQDIFEKPKVICTKSFRRFTTKKSWDSLIHAIIWLALIKRGCTIIHGGSLSYLNKHGIIIGAPADTGKTSTVLSLLSTERFGFMSDDAALIGKGHVYAYPEKVKISPHTLTGSLQVRSWKRKFFKSRTLGLASERILKLNLTHFHKVPDRFVTEKSPIKNVFVFGGYENKRSVKPISPKLAARMLFISSAEMTTLMHRYLELYYYMFGVDTYKIFEKMNDITEKSFKNAQCYLIRAPRLEEYSKMIIKILEQQGE